VQFSRRAVLETGDSISINLIIQELKELKIEDTEEYRLEDLQKTGRKSLSIYKKKTQSISKSLNLCNKSDNIA